MSRDLMLKDLSRSGLNDKQAKKLKLKVLTSKQTVELGHLDAPSYKIPYFGTNGKVLPYYRVRYLETPVGAFGAQLTKTPRYSGPPNTAPQAYFSPLIKWPIALDDVRVPIWITEGEKKGSAGCDAGKHVIALGGVAMFMSRKRGIDFLPELDAIRWKNRPVYIVFDSDKHGNVDIIREQNKLALLLIEREAHVHIIDLPDSDDPDIKVGLDDFLNDFAPKEKPAALDYLQEGCAEEYEASQVLWDLQGQCAIIRKHGAVYVESQKALIKDVGRLAKLDFGDLIYYEPPTHEDGRPTKKRAFDVWLEWKKRRTYEDLEYMPGLGDVVDNVLNVWPGWGVSPSKGNIKPFVELMVFLFRYEPDLIPWFWQWLAYPIQYPGTKMFSAVVLHGPKQGTGKTFLGEIVGDIYGENFSLLSQDDLSDPFNDAFARKQFALADEIVSQNERKFADKLKGMISRETLRINKKYEAKYQLRDTINYYFTSNHADAVYLERDDRRYAIVEVPNEALTGVFYNKLRTWRGNGGAAALMHHLLNVDLTGFDPRAKPPETTAHVQMVENSFSDLDVWADDLALNPDRILSTGKVISPRSLFEPKELLRIYDPQQRRQTSAKALAGALIKARFFRKQVRIPSIGVIRLWAVREPDKWRKRAGSEWAANFEANTPVNLRDKLE